MPRKVKATAEEKVRIVEAYLTGKLGCMEAGLEIGVNSATIRKWASRYRTEGPMYFLPQERNRSYSKEIKLAAVMDYLTGKGSLQQICEQYQIRSDRQLSDWLKVYNRHEDFKEPNGGSRMMKCRETTQEERLEIVRECIARGKNYGAIALKYEVSYRQVYRWVKKYGEMGEAGLEDRRGHRAGTLPSRTPEEELRDRVAQLERKNFDLEMENALLKKVKELERRRR
jgi:transposase-like protein